MSSWRGWVDDDAANRKGACRGTLPSGGRGWVQRPLARWVLGLLRCVPVGRLGGIPGAVSCARLKLQGESGWKPDSYVRFYPAVKLLGAESLPTIRGCLRISQTCVALVFLFSLLFHCHYNKVNFREKAGTLRTPAT